MKVRARPMKKQISIFLFFISFYFCLWGGFERKGEGQSLQNCQFSAKAVGAGRGGAEELVIVTVHVVAQQHCRVEHTRASPALPFIFSPFALCCCCLGLTRPFAGPCYDGFSFVCFLWTGMRSTICTVFSCVSDLFYLGSGRVPLLSPSLGRERKHKIGWIHRSACPPTRPSRACEPAVRGARAELAMEASVSAWKDRIARMHGMQDD